MDILNSYNYPLFKFENNSALHNETWIVALYFILNILFIPQPDGIFPLLIG